MKRELTPRDFFEKRSSQVIDMVNGCQRQEIKDHRDETETQLNSFGGCPPSDGASRCSISLASSSLFSTWPNRIHSAAGEGTRPPTSLDESSQEARHNTKMQTRRSVEGLCLNPCARQEPADINAQVCGDPHAELDIGAAEVA